MTYNTTILHVEAHAKQGIHCFTEVVLIRLFAHLPMAIEIWTFQQSSNDLDRLTLPDKKDSGSSPEADFWNTELPTEQSQLNIVSGSHHNLQIADVRQISDSCQLFILQESRHDDDVLLMHSLSNIYLPLLSWQLCGGGTRLWALATLAN